MKAFKEIWNDSVWSKVIAAFFIAIGTIIWTAFEAWRKEINFKIAFVNFWTFKIELWIIVVVVLFLLALYWAVWYKKQQTFSYDEETLKLDKTLFDRIRNKLLPQNGSIYFLRHNNFAGFSFDTRKLDNLDEIEHESVKSDFEFLHPELEKIKKELIAKIAHFTTQIALETFPTNRGFQTVPPEWEFEQPERFREVVNDLHQTKHEICNKYDELIRTGRRILKI